MIKTHTCYTVACDVCGDELDDGEGIYFASAAPALAYARDLDCWWIGTDNTIVCETRNEDHLTKAREIAATVTTDEARKQFTAMWPDIDLAAFEPRFAAVMPGQTEIPAGA